MSLSDSKSPHVSRKLFNIVPDFNRIVLWMISFLPLISSSSSLLFRTLETDSRAPTAIGKIIMKFQRYFSSLARSAYLSIFWFYFDFHSIVNLKNRIHKRTNPFLLVNNFHPGDFFTPVSISSLSLASERQQVSSSLLDSYKYSS